MSIKIGTPNYEPQNKRFTKHYFDAKLKVGDNIFRILPPVGNCADTGEWMKIHKVHYGFMGTKEEETDSPAYRPFMCVSEGHYDFDDKQWIIDLHCPECDKILEVKKNLETVTASLKAKAMSDESIKENQAVQDLQGWLDKRNLSEKGHLNAYDPSTDKIGLLKIPRGLAKELKIVAKEIRAENKKIDPCGVDSGVLFNFKRTGKGRFNTEYKPLVVMTQKETDEGIFKIIKQFPLSESILQRMETECHELTGMYVQLSSAQVQKMVDADADPTVVDEVFAEYRKTQEANRKPRPTKTIGPTKDAPDNMSDEDFQRSFGG